MDRVKKLNRFLTGVLLTPGICSIAGGLFASHIGQANAACGTRCYLLSNDTWSAFGSCEGGWCYATRPQDSCQNTEPAPSGFVCAQDHQESIQWRAHCNGGSPPSCLGWTDPMSESYQSAPGYSCQTC
jgi:hypothetical protein